MFEMRRISWCEVVTASCDDRKETIQAVKDCGSKFGFSSGHLIMSGSRNESQEVIETGRKGGDLLFKITRVDLSGVLFMLGHNVWRKDLAR